MRGRRWGLVAGLLCVALTPAAQAGSPCTGPALDVRIDPLHPQRVWALGVDGLHRSDDGGVTFRRVSLPLPHHATSVVPVGGGVLVGTTEDQVLRSVDGGRH